FKGFQDNSKSSGYAMENFYSSQTACRANRNFLWPKFFQPARIATSRISENENARWAESRASKRGIGSRKISAVKRKTPVWRKKRRRKSDTRTNVLDNSQHRRRTLTASSSLK